MIAYIRGIVAGAARSLNGVNASSDKPASRGVVVDAGHSRDVDRLGVEDGLPTRYRCTR